MTTKLFTFMKDRTAYIAKTCAMYACEKLRRIGRWRLATIPCVIGILMLLPSAAEAMTIYLQKIVVTDTVDVMETTPVLGADDVSRIVVYTSQTFDTGGGVWEPGVIYAQRLSTDAAIPPLIQVGPGGADNQLPDISGSRVVYTAFTDINSLQGQIHLIDLNDGHTPYVLSDQAMVREARIHGDNVVWIEFFMGTPRVMLKDVGTGAAPLLISDASTQPARSLQIGDTFVVWEVDYDIVAYDLRSGDYVWVADTVERERYPSTSGTWLTWEEEISGLESRILAVDVDGSDPPIVVADNGGVNHAPTIDGDIIAYEALVADGSGGSDFDIFIYQISTGETFPVATGAGDQRLNNVFGDQVAFVDSNTGTNDIAVVTFWFDPCDGVDADYDGVCDGDDNCPTIANPYPQADGDSDGVGDVCDNCVSVANPSQCNLDGDALGDACDPCTFCLPVANAGADQTAHAGTTVNLDGSASSDPDEGPLSYAWEFTDKPAGSTATLTNPNSESPSFVADQVGDYAIKLVVTNEDTLSSEDYVTVSVSNLTPVSDPNGPYLADACQSVTVDGTGSSDPDGDSLSYEWFFQDEQKLGPTVSFAAPCTAGIYPLTLAVDDGRGGTDTATTTVTVEEPNEPPVADPNGPYLGAIDAEIGFDGAASSDPDADPLAYDWDWGDSTSSLDVGGTPTHAYGSAGIYDVCLTVTDPDGESDTACTYVVVYDPSGSFVTGGGWLESPEGAYKSDPSLTGRATFGFVSKYKKGAEVPTGNTEFQFHAADLNFHTDAYEWLVVSGSDYAMFKGVGTINGAGEYRFRIWAGDDEPDTFRIKIWIEEEATGTETVIYDNGMDQAIGGGSIIIHTKSK